MNLAECITAVENQLPVTIVLLNNNVLGMVRQWQTLFYGQRYAHTMLERKASYADVCRAFGGYGVRVESVEELDRELEASMTRPGPTLIEVPIDKDEFVIPMVPAGGSMDDLMTSMDDIRAKVGE